MIKLTCKYSKNHKADKKFGIISSNCDTLLNKLKHIIAKGEVSKTQSHIPIAIQYSRICTNNGIM